MLKYFVEILSIISILPFVMDMRKVNLLNSLNKGATTSKSAAKYGYTLKREDRDIYLIPEADHKFSFIWLHGLGDSADGFLDFFYTEDPIIPNKVNLNISYLMVIEY